MAIPGGVKRPPLRRHRSFPLPHPEVQRSAPPPRRAPRPTGVFRTPRLTSPTRALTRPAPVRRAQRRLPPAPAPRYPVLRHYTPRQQATVVRGAQRAGRRVADRGAIQPRDLAALGAVRAQQQRAMVRRYARSYGISQREAARRIGSALTRSHAEARVPKPPSLSARLLHALFTGDTGQSVRLSNGTTYNFAAPGGGNAAQRAVTRALQPAPTPYDPFPRKFPYSGPLGLGTLSESLGYLQQRNTGTAVRAGNALSAELRRASRRQRSGTGGAAISPAFVRSPLAAVLLGASKAAPVASRIGAGAANDVGQYVLGALPAAAMIGSQAVHDPRAALKTLEQGVIDPIKHPLDHPLFALAMLHGGVRGVSRAAGAAGRSPLSPAVVRRALTTERVPLQIGGPSAKRLVEYRHYSKDPLVKAVQVLMDRTLPDGALIRDQHGRTVRAKLAAETRLASVLGKDAAHRLRKFGDHTADRANSVERANRGQAEADLIRQMPTRAHRGGRAGQALGSYVDRMMRSQPSGPLHLPARAYRPERDVVSLVVSRVIRSEKTFRADLEKELGRLVAREKRGFDSPKEREANLARQTTIRRVLEDPRAMASAKRVAAAGDEIARRGRELTQRAVSQGALTREAAERAPLFDYAMSHMDARYVTAREHAALELEARAAERQAAERLEQARTPANQRAYNEARERRIAVSGRHPALVKRYEAAQSQILRARRSAENIAAEHARAERARLRTLGAQASRRGSRIRAGEGRATAAEQRKLKARDDAITALKAKRKAAEAAHREIKARLGNIRMPDAQAGLRHPDGRFLSNAEIHAHMRDVGEVPFDRHGPVVAYLPHTPDFNSRAAYHRAQALVRRDTVESGFQRTGAAFEKGTVGTAYDSVAQHHIRMGITTGDGAIGQFDKLAREGAIVREDGQAFTAKEAQDYIDNVSNAPGQPKLVMVRLHQARFTEGQRRIIQQIQQPATFDPGAYGSLRDYVEQSFLDRIAQPGETPAWAKGGARNVGLMPAQLVERYRQHLTALGNRSPTRALMAQAFRTAVLPFSVKWLTGNVAEAILRLAVIGGNPLDFAAGRRVVREAEGRPARAIAGRTVMREIVGLDIQHAGLSKELRSSLLGGLLYGERGLTVHRDASYYESTRLKVPAEFIGGLAHTTMLREVTHELMRVPRAIFTLNRALERQAQFVALGRYVRRDIQEFTNSYAQTVRLQRDAVREAARGLYNTPAQADAARFMDETLGKYSRFGPRLRALIQTATPFLPWYLNAARFVFWTLPAKHPFKTAVLIAAEQAFSKDIADQHKDVPPGELKSAVPHGGGYLDLARFTPFGAFTAAAGGDYSQVFSPFFPQFQGIAKASGGIDPFNRPLEVPKTPENPRGNASAADIRKAMANQALEAFVPGLSPTRRVLEGGNTPYSTSSLVFGVKTKPDTAHGYSGVGRLLDPVRPVFLRSEPAPVGKPPGMSTREYRMLLREARQAAQSTGGPSKREQAILLREARQAAGIR